MASLQLIDDIVADHPHLEFYCPPSEGPQLNMFEKFWKLLSHRATHNRVCDDLGDLKRSILVSPCSYQTMRVRSLIAG